LKGFAHATPINALELTAILSVFASKLAKHLRVSQLNSGRYSP